MRPKKQLAARLTKNKTKPAMSNCHRTNNVWGRVHAARDFSPAILLLLAMTAAAEVRLPHLLTTGMVVQRDMPVHVWGAALPKESVTITFRGETRKTNADELGRWSVWLSPGAAGGPFDLKINTITLRDVLVGDVWIAAGQSNMEWPVRWSADPDKERKAANLRACAPRAPCTRSARIR